MHKHILAKYHYPDEQQKFRDRQKSTSAAWHRQERDTPTRPQRIQQHLSHCSMPRMLWRVEMEKFEIDDDRIPLISENYDRPDPMSLRLSNPIVGTNVARFFADSRTFLSKIMLISMPENE